jgi:hypothetical protein
MQGTRPVFDPDSGICMIGEFSEMQANAAAGFLDLVQVIKLYRRIHCLARQFFRPQRPLLLKAIFAFWYRLCYKYCRVFFYLRFQFCVILAASCKRTNFAVFGYGEETHAKYFPCECPSNSVIVFDEGLVY